MIPSGLTSSVIGRAAIGGGYVRVRDRQIVDAVAEFLYDEAALLDEWRLDEWLALFHPEAAKYQIPSPEDLSDDPATTLQLVNDSMTTLAGRVDRLKSKHAHAESPRSRTRRQITNVRVWRGPDDLLSRSVFDVTRVRTGVVGDIGTRRQADSATYADQACGSGHLEQSAECRAAALCAEHCGATRRSHGRRARGIAVSPRSVNAAIGSTCPTSRW